MKIVITGATSGVGQGAARMLAKRGHDLVLLCRNEPRGAAIAQTLRELGAPRVDLVLCDLGVLFSVRTASKHISATYPHIDVLLCCAGIMPWSRQVTEEGIEAVWATNVLGPILLAEQLLPRMAKDGRIVMMGGDLHRYGRIHWEDPELTNNYSALAAGFQAALAKTMWTIAFARRLGNEGSTVAANVFCPGFVKSELMRDFPLWLRPMMATTQLFAQSPDQSAHTPVALAVDPEFSNVSGQYVRYGRTLSPSPLAIDPDAQQRLVALIDQRIHPGPSTPTGGVYPL